jgi:translation initiation factor IF-3
MHNRHKPQTDSTRINSQVRAPEVRLLSPEGDMLGLMSSKDAYFKAQNMGLDLVEISPKSSPPVCKIMDYGKYRYEQQKKRQQAKKNQKTVTVKEVKVRPSIEDHDFNVKLTQIKKFLGEGHKVRVSLRFRGREMSHKHLAQAVFDRILGEVEDISKTELAPKLEGRQMIMILTAA